MIEPTALTKQFDSSEELVSEPRERKKREGEVESIVSDSVRLPTRNWNALISDYNAANKKKFPFSALDCKFIVEFVKKGQHPDIIFNSLGFSNTRFSNMVTNAFQYDERLEKLAGKENLTDEEYDEFNSLLRHPTRVLMSDIARASGICAMMDWELFNEESRRQPDLLMSKMRSKFRDKFSEKDASANGANIQINIAGDWLERL